ncbi:MAG: hypothetical protein KF902_11920 [Phycisphaeraceae bacterium]|nr:hypothetical protein [Phycisphaeraceae bacterium]MCW5769847.1 hypothetical protein [Phycisphaeraceae bacterium]
MIIEHTFVTTLDPDDAFAGADQYLGPLGFERPMEGIDTSSPDHGFREWTRGKDNPAKAKVPTQLPQRLRMDFDRGRVTMAYAVTFTHPAKAAKHLKASALALCAGVEQLLTGARSCDELITEVRELEEELDRRARKSKTVAAVLLGAFVAIIVGGVIIAVLSLP